VTAGLVRPLTVRTLGTGSADHDCKRIASPVCAVRCDLIDGHVLIDCGTTGYTTLTRFDIPPRALNRSAGHTHFARSPFRPDQSTTCWNALFPTCRRSDLASPQAPPRLRARNRAVSRRMIRSSPHGLRT
jgi:hypothetical protein